MTKWYDNISNLTDFANTLTQAGLIENLGDLEHLIQNPDKYDDAFYFYKKEILGEDIETNSSIHDNGQDYLTKLGIDKIIIVHELDKLDNILESDGLKDGLKLNFDDIKNVKLFLLRNIILLIK